MPSGRATKPGDVVTAMNGKTIQVTVVYLGVCDACIWVFDSCNALNYSGNCCGFGPANRGFAGRSLVEIILLGIFTYFYVKKEEKIEIFLVDTL